MDQLIWKAIENQEVSFILQQSLHIPVICNSLRSKVHIVIQNAFHGCVCPAVISQHPSSVQSKAPKS